jgi:hypothetical protein
MVDYKTLIKLRKMRESIVSGIKEELSDEDVIERVVECAFDPVRVLATVSADRLTALIPALYTALVRNIGMTLWTRVETTQTYFVNFIKMLMVINYSPTTEFTSKLGGIVIGAFHMNDSTQPMFIHLRSLFAGINDQMLKNTKVPLTCYQVMFDYMKTCDESYVETLATRTAQVFGISLTDSRIVNYINLTDMEPIRDVYRFVLETGVKLYENGNSDVIEMMGPYSYQAQLIMHFCPELITRFVKLPDIMSRLSKSTITVQPTHELNKIIGCFNDQTRESIVTAVPSFFGTSYSYKLPFFQYFLLCHPTTFVELCSVSQFVNMCDWHDVSVMVQYLTAVIKSCDSMNVANAIIGLLHHFNESHDEFKRIFIIPRKDTANMTLVNVITASQQRLRESVLKLTEVWKSGNLEVCKNFDNELSGFIVRSNKLIGSHIAPIGELVTLLNKMKHFNMEMYKKHQNYREKFDVTHYNIKEFLSTSSAICKLHGGQNVFQLIKGQYFEKEYIDALISNPYIKTVPTASKSKRR